MLDPFAVTYERLLAIEKIDRFVERTVRLAEILRHDVWIIKIGERRAFMRRARIEHRLREFFELLFGGIVELRLGEGIVDDADGIPVIVF